MAIEDVTAKALCGVMEKALVAEGVDPGIAKVLSQRACHPVVKSGTRRVAKTAKRKASAYSKKYGKAFKKVANKFKKKNGAWKANGFKNAQKAAHKLAKRMR
jgi:2-phosphoglycerate kinase